MRWGPWQKYMMLAHAMGTVIAPSLPYCVGSVQWEGPQHG
jgi:hypothetical protein